MLRPTKHLLKPDTAEDRLSQAMPYREGGDGRHERSSDHR
jgi:hypothetical protein